jgi:hypothetical protein
MLVLHCMNLTLDEIATHRARLREEIMERECLLAAFDVVEKYAASGHRPKSMQLGSLLSALLPSRPAVELKELSTSATPTSLPPPARAALPPTPPVERYVHPELKALRYNLHGRNSNLVRWAIQRMKEDYSLHDIGAMLEREGAPVRPPEISVVLTRLKARGEIEEIKRSAGPHPAIFRKVESATPFPANPEDSAANTETTAMAAAVS